MCVEGGISDASEKSYVSLLEGKRICAEIGVLRDGAKLGTGSEAQLEVCLITSDDDPDVIVSPDAALFGRLRAVVKTSGQWNLTDVRCITLEAVISEGLCGPWSEEESDGE